jgi:hypothetical protein
MSFVNLGLGNERDRRFEGIFLAIHFNLLLAPAVALK